MTFKRGKLTSKLVREDGLALIAIFIIMILFILFAWFSEGVSEYDEYRHYFISKYEILHNPTNLVETWPKPIFTILSFIMIQLTGMGINSVRIMNAIFSSSCCYFTYLLSKKIGIPKKFALSTIVFTAFAPLFTFYAFSALTEPLFSLLLILATYFYYSHRFKLSAFLLSLSCMTNYMAFIFFPILFFLSPKHLKAEIFVILASIPLLWNILGYIDTGKPFFLITETWYYQYLHNVYVHGSIFFYVLNLIRILGPISYIIFQIGFFYQLKNREFQFLNISVIVFILFHSVTWQFGLLGSAGFLRYMMPIIPFFGVYSSIGLQKFFETINTEIKLIYHLKLSDFFYYILISQAIILCFSYSTLPGKGDVRPLKLSPKDQIAKEAGLWIQKHNSDGNIYINHLMIIYYAEIDLYAENVHGLSEIKKNIPKGSIIVWENEFSDEKTRNTLMDSSQFVILKEWGVADLKIEIYMKL